MQTWEDLLGREFEGLRDESKYGPNSQIVWSTIAAISEIQWLEKVGDPISARVVTVHSWDEAWTIFTDQTEQVYGPYGHLVVPTERVWTIAKSPKYGPWWEKSLRDIDEYYNYEGFIPAWMKKTNTPRGRLMEAEINEYLFEFIKFLMAEVVGADVVKSTYFREQLAWFHAGHFPCGWVGDWPVGQMRIY